MFKAIVLKSIVAATLPAALFWTFGFVCEHWLETVLPAATGMSEHTVTSLLLGLLYISCGGTLSLLSLRHPKFMHIPTSVRESSAIAVFVVLVVASYVLCALCVFVISRVALQVDPGAIPAEGLQLSVLLSLWLPLWWMLPIAAVGTAVVVNRQRS